MTPELNQFVSDIDTFKLAVVEGRACLATATKLISAGMRLVKPVEDSGATIVPDELPESIVESYEVTNGEAKPEFEVVNLDDGSVVPLAELEIAKQNNDELQVEVTPSTELESLGLSAKTIALLKDGTNGPAITTVEELKAFVESGGGDLSNAKKGIGAKIEEEILSKLQ